MVVVMVIGVPVRVRIVVAVVGTPFGPVRTV